MFFLMFFPDVFQGGFGPPFGSLLGAILGHFLALKIDGVLEPFPRGSWRAWRLEFVDPVHENEGSFIEHLMHF